MAFLELDLRADVGRFHLAIRADLGEAIAVLGPSGAGKTTLLEAITGLVRAKGRLVIDGRVVLDSARRINTPPERRRLGYVPQDGALFPHLSVRENLRFSVPRTKATKANDRSPFDELVSMLALEDLLDRMPRHLSGGEKRRVALGRALLSEPCLLLLDEPTAGLDPVRARKALAGLRRLRSERGVPLLLVTHDRREALALADEVLMLEHGKVRAHGPAREILLAPERLAELSDGAWENVAAARVFAHDEQGGITEVRLVENGHETISIPWTPDLPLGAEILLAIDAGDLLIALAPPSGLSARNALAGTIDTLLTPGSAVYARVGPWLAHLTPAAVKDLGLEVGTSVWLVAKTHSWRVAAG